MTKEHLGLALALAVPVFVVVTKIDMCPPNVLQVNLFKKNNNYRVKQSNVQVILKLTFKIVIMYLYA